MMDTSIHCAWWVSMFAPLVSYWKRYGWGIWSGDQSISCTWTVGVRPLLVALGFVGLAVVVALKIVASLKRRGWGTWSGATNLDAGRGGVRAAAHELLERLYIAWWWGPVAPLVSWWKRSFWSGRNNIRANNAGVPWPTPRRRRQQPWPGAAMHLKRRRRLTAGTHHFDRASRSTL